jgi:hypothetical protein
MAVTVARRRQPLPGAELSTMAAADHYFQVPQQQLPDAGQPHHHHQQPGNVYSDSFHVVSNAVAISYRDPTTAPLRKLSVDLIKTYKLINEVTNVESLLVSFWADS